MNAQKARRIADDSGVKLREYERTLKEAYGSIEHAAGLGKFRVTYISSVERYNLILKRLMQDGFCVSYLDGCIDINWIE